MGAAEPRGAPATTYDKPTVTFKSDVEIANRLCQAFNGICGRIEDMILRKVRQGVESGVEKALGGKDVRSAVAANVLEHAAIASKLTGFHVESIRSEGDDFIVLVSR